MAATIEVKYFNSFLLKKTIEEAPTSVFASAWNGSTGVPSGVVGAYPVSTNTVQSGTYNPPGPADTMSFTSWFVEEARIRGGYNNTNVSYGVRAYLVEEEPKSSIRFNSLIYSGIFNSRTGINDTNVFSIGQDITKSVDPANGSIQKLYAEDTNLIVFQENKVSRALIDKDAIYSAEGGGTVTSSNLVIGQIVPYAGNFGISKNPESFAVYGYRKYFTDKNRNAVIRLSMDGITEISNYSMVDYFRDELSALDGVSTPGKAIGAWDIYNKQYVLSLQNKNEVSNSQVNGAVNNSKTINLTSVTGIIPGLNVFGTGVKPGTIVASVDTTNTFNPSITVNKNQTIANSTILSFTGYNTLSFDESILGWTSLFDYEPEQAFSLGSKYYSVRDGKIWQHYSDNVSRNNLYGVQYDSSIEFIFNPSPSTSKVFKTVNYEGSNGWEVPSFNAARSFELNDTSNPVLSYEDGTYTDPEYGVQLHAGFNKKEGKYYANLVNSSPATEGEVVFGAAMTGVKGYYSTVTIKSDSDNRSLPLELFAVSSEYVVSAF